MINRKAGRGGVKMRCQYCDESETSICCICQDIELENVRKQVLEEVLKTIQLGRFTGYNKKFDDGEFIKWLEAKLKELEKK